MATFDVLMPVKNGVTYLRDAIESIRQQTWSDWRMFVLDHASIDGSLELAQEFAYADDRIVVVPFVEELSFCAMLNVALDLCDAEYVLRHDASNVSLPNRMRVLAAAFEADPEVVLLGSQGNVVDGAGRLLGRIHVPLSPERIAAMSFFRLPVLPSTAAIRLAACDRLGVRYGKDFIHAVPKAERFDFSGCAEDYYLLGQLALTTRCRNVKDCLLNFRLGGENIGVKKETEEISTIVAISRYLARNYSLIRNVPEFDPAPMCNHGYRLVKFEERDNFQAEFLTTCDSLRRGLGESDHLENELAFRSCLSNRRRDKMVRKYACYAAKWGVDFSELHTIKSWITHR